MALDRKLARFLDTIVSRVAKIDGVVSIVLGGSQARGTADSDSDVDLALYYEPGAPFSIEELGRAAQELDDRHASGLVTNFGDWGPAVNGGGWLIVGGQHVDFLYRDLAAVRDAIERCRAGQPSSVYQLGHPMGFPKQIYAGEVNCCVPLHDPKRAIAMLKTKVSPYPRALRQALIRKHLFDAAFELAITDKPIRRGDVMYAAGCLFRAAGFMTMVLYALNRRYWMNEKGALAESRTFKTVPRGFHSTVRHVLANPGATPSAMARSVVRFQKLVESLRTLAGLRADALPALR